MYTVKMTEHAITRPNGAGDMTCLIAFGGGACNEG